jgi:choline dehydrogenase-like flavoprotein
VSDYDVIIVGSGAGGGTLARTLGEQGKRVLILERGDWVPREPQNWDAGEVFERARYVSRESWLDRRGRFFQPQVHYNVGGATKFYGAALFRLRAADFGEIRHYGGTSPAWPVSYLDLMPYYQTAERLYSVHGAAGEDLTEPLRLDYPFLPVRHEPVIQQIADGFAKAGLHPAHAPCAVNLNEARPQSSPCIKCHACDGFACPLLAKSDAETCGIRPALDTGNVTLVTGARVTRLLRQRGDQIVGVQYQDAEDRTQVATADVYVLAAGAVNSAALWLRSGLPDQSGQAGRNYMCHESQAVLAVGKDKLPPGFHKTLAVSDWYSTGPDGLPLGSVQMAGQPQAAMLRGESRFAGIAPGRALREVAQRSVVFWLMSEDLPSPANRVEVREDGHVQLSYGAGANVQAARKLYRELAQLLPALGYGEHMRKVMPLAAVAHQCGTLRAGLSPDSSVVNSDGRAWGAGNLYVADASVFPSAGAVNPALTVMAWALRLGQHLGERT